MALLLTRMGICLPLLCVMVTKFVTITHKGVIRQSEEFDITAAGLGDLATVLGCLIEKEKNNWHLLDDDDPAIDLDDNEFMSPPPDDDYYSD